MRRVLKQRSKRRGASGFGGGIESPVASENAACLEEVTALLARIDEMILNS
jgi:preprotein translocase subunit SecG